LWVQKENAIRTNRSNDLGLVATSWILKMMDNGRILKSNVVYVRPFRIVKRRMYVYAIAYLHKLYESILFLARMRTRNSI